MNQTVTVLARFKAKPGLEPRLRDRLLALMSPSRRDPGCLNYDLHQGLEDQTQFVFHENWESRGHLEAHRQTPHVQGFLTTMEPLLAEPPQSSLWVKISG
jgi:quinol monooxygenase YgiN